MTHDPLCPCGEVPSGRYCYLINPETGRCIECDCWLIAKVRKEEADRVMSLRYNEVKGWSDMMQARAWERGQQDMLAKAIAAVEYLHDHEAPHDAHKDALWNTITALRALQEKP